MFAKPGYQRDEAARPFGNEGCRSLVFELKKALKHADKVGGRIIEVGGM